MAKYGNMDQAFPGLLYGRDHHIDSRVAVGDIGYGVPVFTAGENKGKAKGDCLLGISARHCTTKDYVEDKDVVSVVRTGKVWAKAAAGLAADAEVSVNGSAGTIVAKTSEAAGARRTLAVTIANNATAAGKVTLIIGGTAYVVDVESSGTPATTASALVSALTADASCPFTAIAAAGAAVTLTAKDKGVAQNDIAIVGTSTATSQTITIGSNTAAGADAIINPGWHVRTSTNAEGLAVLDLDK